jgi:aryl-alcohol dehydrogenase-like predicted oxidoreductase
LLGIAVGKLTTEGIMDYINLGKTGLKVSRICLGCMTYGAPATGEIKGQPERRV